MILNKTCNHCGSSYTCDGSCKNTFRIEGTGKGVNCYCSTCVRKYVKIRKEDWGSYKSDRKNCSILSKKDWEYLERRSIFTWILE